jgi:hypothetical protein
LLTIVTVGVVLIGLAFRRHGHVDPREVASQLDEAGLQCVDGGPVGISTLHFVLAVPAT